MSNPGQKLLETMLSRLYAALASGPLLNCRPFRSRQRICLHELSLLDGPRPQEMMSLLLSEPGKVKLTFPAALPKDESGDAKRDVPNALQAKLKTIISDANAYEKQTGDQALFLGYPLLSLSSVSSAINGEPTGKRVLAPLAFIPIKMRLSTARRSVLYIESSGAGADLVIANQALMVWAQQVTGQRTGELFTDEAGTEPWREIGEIAATVCKLFELPTQAVFDPKSPIVAVPSADCHEPKVAQIVPACVLGLFPLSNQNLLRDLEALVDGERAEGPIRAFLEHDSAVEKLHEVSSSSDTQSRSSGSVSPKTTLGVGDDRAVSEADPCQLQAVLRARSADILVLHGPPGTGKSQTITNVIADHLALGQRVLFVCDKRTALDVVEARLRRLGLMHLCAVVHDSRRDEKDLYRSIREQLDNLEATADEDRAVGTELGLADLELKRIVSELATYHHYSHTSVGGGEMPLQDLLGRMWQIEPQALVLPAIRNVTVSQFDALASELRELIERAISTRFSENPWVRACGISLREYLAQPLPTWLSQLERVSEHAKALDGLGIAELPLIPALPLQSQIQSRTQLVSMLAQVFQAGSQSSLQFWAGHDTVTRDRVAAEIWSLLPLAQSLCQAPQDGELARAFAAQALPTQVELQSFALALAQYRDSDEKWYGAICVGKQQTARDVLARFGQPLSIDASLRVAAFLEQLKLRRILYDWYVRMFGPTQVLPSDRTFLQILQNLQLVFQLLSFIERDTCLLPFAATLFPRLRSPNAVPSLLGALQDSCARGERMVALESQLAETPLLAKSFAVEVYREAYQGRAVTPIFGSLRSWFSCIEGGLRVVEGLRCLPDALAHALTPLLNAQNSPTACLSAMERAIVEGAILQQLEVTPELSLLDEERYRSCFTQYSALRSKRQELAKLHIANLWRTSQRQRLTTSPSGRVNSAGAELKRRFLMRGENAMRLRQAILVGRSPEGPDPLFSLRPVWMTSPAVAAQVFPREAVFDLLIFDEASQCRIEEALPIMLRAKRLLIAGDPEQLPPTRFFETGAQVADLTEPETSQELFEQQQTQVEDLLGNALNLSVEQSYLDVHYRSKHPELIAFSNQHFYSSRLVPLPTKGGQDATVSPIRLVSAGGTYEARGNPIEAAVVIDIVRELLGRGNPPSIGIACFNLAQRDTIEAALEQAALQDEAFASQLETARSRQGEGAFEGLFVKNLENVQGDERDHIIISTTYGPDSSGQFFRRFGPLAQAGGGRRLNVLITRARTQVHVVTSIPAEVYRALPPLESGCRPNGSWLLLSYIAFAEDLTRAFETGDVASRALAVALGGMRKPSMLATALKACLRDCEVDVQVPWGTSGLGADLCVSKSGMPGDSLLINCDLAQYERASNPVEWDLFREQVLLRQGFELMRTFSPRLFRNRDLELAKLLTRVIGPSAPVER